MNFACTGYDSVFADSVFACWCGMQAVGFPVCGPDTTSENPVVGELCIAEGRYCGCGYPNCENVELAPAVFTSDPTGSLDPSSTVDLCPLIDTDLCDCDNFCKLPDRRRRLRGLLFGRAGPDTFNYDDLPCGDCSGYGRRRMTE